MEADMIRKAAHPPYSPDSAPSGFFQFGFVKRTLSPYSFDNADELLGVIHEVLRVFEAATLNRLFCEWMTRVQECIDTKGENIGRLQQ
jgi:hypothetical protein